MKREIILASASPRRKELLSRFVSDFSIRVADIDETVPTKMLPEETAAYVAAKKAEKINLTAPCNSLIIAADTIVCLKDKIYGKPQSAEDAELMLKELRGQSHNVITAVVCIDKISGKILKFSETTTVFFVNYSDNIIKKYIESHEPFDKAGAYAIQETGCILVEKIIGDYDNVVGLPIAKLIRELESINVFLY